MEEKQTALSDTIIEKRNYLSPRLYCLLLLFFFLGSFTIRLMRYEDVIIKDEVLFLGFDSYYHMRRAHASIDSWPWLLQFDSYHDYPHGAGIIFTPGFSFMITTAGLIAGGGNYVPKAVDLAGALLPPFIGSLVIFALALVARQLFGREAAIWASLLFTVMIGAIWPAFFGNVDHHVAEFLFTPLIFASCLVILRISPDERFRARIPRIIFLATTITTGQLVWCGAIAYSSVLLASTTLILIWRRLKANQAEKKAFTLPFFDIALSLCTTAIVLYPWCSNSWFGTHDMFVYYALSWFHLFYYLSGAITCFIIFVIFRGTACFTLRVNTIIFPVFFCIIIIFLLLSPVKPHTIFQVIFSGIGYLGKSDSWMQTIAESKSIFAYGLQRGISSLFYFYGCWWTIIPFPLLFLFLKRKGDPAYSILLFAIWLFFNVLLTTKQIRYNHQLAVTLCILGGWFLSQCRSWLMPFCRKYINNGLGLFISTIILTSLLALSLSTTSFINLYTLYETRGDRFDSLSPSLAKTFQWFDTHTPRTRCYENPSCRPEYSVLTFWDFGHWLLYFGKRPIIASNFGFIHQGLAKSSEFLSTTSWSRAEKILHLNGVRYVLLGDFSALSYKLGMIFTDLTSLPHPLANGGIPISDLIYRSDALADSIIEGDQGIREHLRLRYESPPTISHLASYHPMIFKIFEFVPGCLISIKAKPRQKVSLSIALMTNRDRRFLYRREAVTDNEGHLRLIIPYSTDSTENVFPWHDVHALSNCRLTIGDKSIDLVIPEQHVLSGNQIDLALDSHDNLFLTNR